MVSLTVTLACDMVPGAGWASVCLGDWGGLRPRHLVRSWSSGAGAGQTELRRTGRKRPGWALGLLGPSMGGPARGQMRAHSVGLPTGRVGAGGGSAGQGPQGRGRALPTLLVPFDDTGRGLVADGRGVGLPLAPGELTQLQREVPDRGGAVAARHPPQTQAARRHVGLGHLELPGGRGPLCDRERTPGQGRGHLEWFRGGLAAARGTGCPAQTASRPSSTAM